MLRVDKSAKIPTKQEIAQSLAIDKLNPNLYTPTGIYAKSVNEERKQIREEYRKHRGEELPWLGYVPNSQMPFVNKLLRIILTAKKTGTGKISKPDFEFLEKLWMDDNQHKSMLDWFSKYIDPELQGFSAPIKTKSPFGPDVDSSGKKLVYKLRNPGMVYDQPFVNETKQRLFDTKYVDQIIDTINQNVSKMYDELEELQDLEPMFSADMGGPTNST